MFQTRLNLPSWNWEKEKYLKKWETEWQSRLDSSIITTIDEREWRWRRRVRSFNLCIRLGREGRWRFFMVLGKGEEFFFLMTVGRTGVALEGVPPYWEGEWNVLMINVLREIVVMSFTIDLSFRLQCFVLSFFYFEFVCCLFKMRLGLMIFKK